MELGSWLSRSLERITRTFSAFGVILNLMAEWQTPPKVGLDFEVHLDGADGKLLGKGSILPPIDKKATGGMVHISLSAITDGSMHSIYITSKRKEKETTTIGLSGVQFGGK